MMQPCLAGMVYSDVKPEKLVWDKCPCCVELEKENKRLKAENEKLRGYQAEQYHGSS